MKTYISNLNQEIYRNIDRYAGWPANYGIWKWENEIVLIFTSGYPNIEGGFHARDRSKPLVTMQARSLDNGITWSVSECPIPYGVGLGAYEHMNQDVIDSLEEIRFEEPKSFDFNNKDFAVMCGKTGLSKGAESWYYISNDRCKNWNGPYRIPMFNQSGIAARTDWLIQDNKTAVIMLTATKTNGKEGRVFSCITKDGGKTLEFLSWINEFPEGYDIMPSSIQLTNGNILTAIRSKGSKLENCWIDLFISKDNGLSWKYLSRPVDSTGKGGNPGSLVQLDDGRLVITYGSRKDPYGIYAVISENEGNHWSKPICLRKSSGNHDIGYTRSVLRDDGKLITAYYINDDPNGERFIESAITEF